MQLKKLTKYFLLVLLVLNKSDNIVKSVNYTNLAFFKEVIPKLSNEITLIIPQIDLEVYTSYTSNLKEGLEIHPLSTRPSDDKSTLIIMGHSGIGQNVYFNNLIYLNINDLIIIEYSNNIYNYYINSIDIITKGLPYNFELSNDNLYLITCYKQDKQVIIQAKMAKN